MYPRSRRPAKLSVFKRVEALSILALCLSLALGACAGREPPPVPEIRAGHDRAGDSLTVRVVNLPAGTRVTSIRLTGPDGERYDGQDRRTRRGEVYRGGRPGIGVRAHGGSATGITPGLTLSWDVFDSLGRGLWGGRETRDLREVSARIPLPEDYREPNPEAWRVVVTLRDASGRARDKTAPAPR